MSVFLMQNQCYPFTFSKSTVKLSSHHQFGSQPGDPMFNASEKFILQDKQLTNTGEKGLLSGKQFPWTVFLSASSYPVKPNLGFNLDVTFSLNTTTMILSGLNAPYNKLQITMKANFESLLQHVFNQPPGSGMPALVINLVFDFDEEKETLRRHVLACDCIDEVGQFFTQVDLIDEVAQKIRNSCGSTISVCMTIELCISSHFTAEPLRD